ncbi:MAG: hypothetical protein ACOVOT_16700 [Rubrivivax sp.]|nr:hypothetical protein [Rubrivivax sp.]
MAVPPAPPKPVELAPDFFASKAKSGRIGVAVSEFPKADTQFPGAYCLLCLAVASGAHSKLTDHVRTLSTDDLKPMQANLAELLRKRGMDVVVIDAPVKMAELPDFKGTGSAEQAFSPKDFSALKAKHGIDRLVMVNIGYLGVWRSYSAYVPTDVPKAVVGGHGYLIDLSTHRLEWSAPLSISRSAEGAWDEPPKFPGLTNAYFQALEDAIQAVTRPFVAAK